MLPTLCIGMWQPMTARFSRLPEIFYWRKVPQFPELPSLRPDAAEVGRAIAEAIASMDDQHVGELTLDFLDFDAWWCFGWSKKYIRITMIRHGLHEFRVATSEAVLDHDFLSLHYEGLYGLWAWTMHDCDIIYILFIYIYIYLQNIVELVVNMACVRPVAFLLSVVDLVGSMQRAAEHGAYIVMTATVLHTGDPIKSK